MFFCSVSWGNDCQSSKKMSNFNSERCGIQSQEKYEKDCNKNSSCATQCNKEHKTYEELDIEDDEYCTYNQCYFDKQYRKLKNSLCLTRRQESCLDNIYRDFKSDMERQCIKYRNAKNQLLETIECDNGCKKEYKNALKEIKKENKAKLKDFDEEIKAQLCKNQKKDYRKFKHHQNKKMRQIVKYATVYKFPCINCKKESCP